MNEKKSLGKSFLSRKTRNAPKSRHYVDNEKLHAEMLSFIEKCETAGVLKVKQKEWDEKGLIRPDIPNYVGEAILNISNKTSMAMSFRNYPFREELVSDGIENCIKYITNYDPKKYNNPLAYFTQICYFAFLRRISNEKKALYIKYKAIDNSEIFGLLHEEDQNYMSSIGADIGYSESARENMYRFIETYEENK